MLNFASKTYKSDMGKIIIYQVLVRLFHSRNTEPVYNGTIEQNGCGKMANFTLSVLNKLRSIGYTHIWYTGLLRHATCTDYSRWGLTHDHSAIVKGRAGSPYAVRDYYDIDPDLAVHPNKRHKEFMDLVERTHKAGLKIVMDFVPNHVARQYGSAETSAPHRAGDEVSAPSQPQEHWQPKDVKALGQDDNPQQAFSPSNNFYYIPGQRLQCQFDMQGSEAEPYVEMPAKATGNDCFNAMPTRNDWYETVKLNYGVDYVGGGRKYFSPVQTPFSKSKICRGDPVPDTWGKMLDILKFWAGKGVDAFRCDMAEMVPVEFWDWAIGRLKEAYPDVQMIGEVYNPDMYRDYIRHGRFDYLYDKVGLYDKLRAVIRMESPAYEITSCWQSVDDIRPHMLYFLENHDEQRVASDFFASDARKGIPAMGVILLLGTNPSMIYFAQMLGERGMDQEGFSGLDGRTTIFDYWSVKALHGLLKRGRLTLNSSRKEQRALILSYQSLISLAAKEDVFLRGRFFDLMYANMDNPALDKFRVYTFLRFTELERALVVCNFSDYEGIITVNIPAHAVEFMKMKEGDYQVEPAYSVALPVTYHLSPTRGGSIDVDVKSWGVSVIKLLNPKI